MKLKLSGIPPTIQEYLISNVSDFKDADLEEMVGVLNNLAKVEGGYMKAIDQYELFLKKLGESIADKQKDEVKKIEGELEAEIAKVLMQKGNG